MKISVIDPEAEADIHETDKTVLNLVTMQIPAAGGVMMMVTHRGANGAVACRGEGRRRDQSDGIDHPPGSWRPLRPSTRNRPNPNVGKIASHCGDDLSPW